eukprot:c11521_g1_i1 orf=94-1761(+)
MCGGLEGATVVSNHSLVCRPSSSFLHPKSSTRGIISGKRTIIFAERIKVRCLSDSVTTPVGSVKTQVSMEFFPSDLSPENSGIVPQELAEQIVPEALAWASLHGILMGDKSIKSSGTIPGTGLVHAPISLLPSSFLEKHFKQAIELAPLFNELIDTVSRDHKFLQESLSRTREADTFTARLLDIHSTVLDEGIKQVVQLGLHRSDYMADSRTGDLLQVEINTISSSFAGLGSRVTYLHRYLVDFIGKRSNLDAKKIPENKAVDGFAKAISLAFNEFGDPSAVVLMVIQPGERNMYDQYWLSTRLYEKYGIYVIRKTFAEVFMEGKLHQDGTLAIGKQTVALVYYRAGYDPKDYPSENEWIARTLMERSNAIKCPSITYHLAGTKKIQQELAKPGMLERFVEKADDACNLRKCFAGLWGFDDNKETEIIKDAIVNPEAFVLKPQREGGGNNLFGDDIRKKLEELKEGRTADSFAAYILMQRIFPSIHTTYFMRNGELIAQRAVSELGIYSTYVRNKDKIVLNEQSGYLLRTKASDTDEGGVATGFAVLDSVYLVEG